MLMKRRVMVIGLAEIYPALTASVSSARGVVNCAEMRKTLFNGLSKRDPV